MLAPDIVVGKHPANTSSPVVPLRGSRERSFPGDRHAATYMTLRWLDRQSQRSRSAFRKVRVRKPSRESVAATRSDRSSSLSSWFSNGGQTKSAYRGDRRARSRADGAAGLQSEHVPAVCCDGPGLVQGSPPARASGVGMFFVGARRARSRVAVWRVICAEVGAADVLPRALTGSGATVRGADRGLIPANPRSRIFVNVRGRRARPDEMSFI